MTCSQSKYDRDVLNGVWELPRVDIGSVVARQVTEEEVQIRYSTKKEFEVIAKKLKIMSDFRVSEVIAVHSVTDVSKIVVD